jgi:hypothetical protein
MILSSPTPPSISTGIGTRPSILMMSLPLPPSATIQHRRLRGVGVLGLGGGPSVP